MSSSVRLAIWALFVASALAQTFDVTAFGAKGDGRSDDTAAIRAASAALKSAGGGILLFQPGFTFLTLPFNISSNCVMILEGNIVFHPNITLYNLVPYLPSYGTGLENVSPLPGPRYEPQLGAFGASNITIMGGGTLDGNGAVWWAAKKNNQLAWTRPHLIEMNTVQNLKIVGISLKNSPYWALHPVYCQGVLIEGVIISSQISSPQTDCITADSSQDVVIRNVDLQGGNDCVAIKSGLDNAGLAFNMSSANILIENSRMGPCGAISFGSESSGGIRNVTVRNVLMQGTDAGFYIKGGRGHGGVVQQLRMENVNLRNAVLGIVVNMFDSGQQPSSNVTTTPKLFDVTFSNITGSPMVAAGQFCCLAEMPCAQINMQNVQFSATITAYSNCEWVSGTLSGSNTPAPDNCFASGKSDRADLYRFWYAQMRVRERTSIANPLCPLLPGTL